MTCDHKFIFLIATIQLCDLSSKSATACGTPLPVFHFLSFLYNWFSIDQEKTPFMQTSKPDVPSSYRCRLQWEKNAKMMQNNLHIGACNTIMVSTFTPWFGLSLFRLWLHSLSSCYFLICDPQEVILCLFYETHEIKGFFCISHEIIAKNKRIFN